MPYDVKGALDAGWSEDEILAHLTESRGVDPSTLLGTAGQRIRQVLRQTGGTLGRIFLGRPQEHVTTSFRPMAIGEELPPPATPGTTYGVSGSWDARQPWETPAPTMQGLSSQFAPDFVNRYRDLSQRMSLHTPTLGGPVFNPMADVEGVPESMVTGLRDVRYGVTPEERAAGASRFIRGGMPASAPLILRWGASAPWRTFGTLGAAMGIQHGVESGAQSLGVKPGYAALAGDIAGFGAGAYAHGLPWERTAGELRNPAMRSLALRGLMRNEAGEIIIGPSEGWTSTLRDLIEQKAPGKISPEQLQSIASQAP